ncbi:MAG: hypothetical protein GC165_02910 [Armatimonadetes bacterium]|nr:hypothetical protein [Armatimonadota bacterium]
MFAPLILGFVVATRQVPKVSLDLRGVRLENAANTLAQTLGLDSLQIGPTLTNEVLLVRAHDVDPETLKAKIALALHATWEHRSEGWWLAQTDEQKDADKKTFTKNRYEFINEILRTSKKRYADMKPFDEAACRQIQRGLEELSKSAPPKGDYFDDPRAVKLDLQGPASRLTTAIGLRLTPDMLLHLTGETPRIVFSNHPTQTQYPMPFATDDLLRQLCDQQTLWSNIAGTTPVQGSRREGQGTPVFLGDMNQRREPLHLSDCYMVTVAFQLPYSTFTVNVYDRKGKQVFNADDNLFDEDDTEATGNTTYDQEIEDSIRKATKLTGIAKEYADAVSPVDPRLLRGENKALSPQLLQMVLQPETIDPLSIAAPDVYLGAIPEPNVAMVLSEDERAVRTAEFLDDSYAKYGDGTITRGDGWFVLAHKDPIVSRAQFVDRKVLGPAFRYLNKVRRPLSIEEQGELADRFPWEFDWTGRYNDYLRLIKTDEVEFNSDQSGLRFYGALTSDQREAAKKSGITIDRLSESARLELFRAIYYNQFGMSRLDVDEDLYQHEMTDKEQQQINEVEELIFQGIYAEPTFALPDGLNGKFILKITDETEPTLYCGSQPVHTEFGTMANGRSMTPEDLGQLLFMATKPETYGENYDPYFKLDDKNIRIASARSLSIKVMVSPLLCYQWHLGQTIVTDPKTYTAANLPSEIQLKVKQAFDDMAKSDKEGGAFRDQFRFNPRRVPPPAVIPPALR